MRGGGDGETHEEGVVEEEAPELDCVNEERAVILGEGRTMGKGRCFHGAGVPLGHMGTMREGCGLYLQVTDSHLCPADAPSQSLLALGLASETSSVG